MSNQEQGQAEVESRTPGFAIVCLVEGQEEADISRWTLRKQDGLMI